MVINLESSSTINDIHVIHTENILDKDFKVYGDLENPLFLAKDVSEWIDYAYKDSSKTHRDVSKMLNTVDEDEKIKSTIKLGGENYTHGGIRENTEMWFLTEDGLYEVLMQSRKPIAKQFKKRVKKILKQIRHTGGYIPHDEEMSDEEIMARALQVAQRTIEKKNKELKLAEDENLKLASTIEKQKPKVEYVDEVLKSKDALLITNIAFDYGISAQRLNKILCEEKVQRKVRNQYILYADYLGKGYTETETKVHNGKTITQTLCSQKGRLLIHQILKKREINALMDR